MSMLGEQIKELREAARNIQGKLGRCLYRRKDVDEMQQVSSMLFEAANTITSLRDRLQAAELGSGTCEFNVVEEFIPGKRQRWNICECSNCGFIVDERFKCCPNCGKRIRKEVDA